jgi:hypothetical protein
MAQSINRDELTEALRKWDAEAKAANFQDREDDQRFADSANYLFGLAGK